MRVEWKPYTGSHGIHWSVCAVSVMPADAAQLRHINFAQGSSANFRVAQMVTSLYDRMLAGDRTCMVRIAVSKPIERDQAESLNVSKATVGNIAAGAFGALAARAHPFLGIPGGYLGREMVSGELPVYHQQDILVAVEAEVSGGIGPQRSARSEILNADR
ncbi:MAG: hypothetical protein ABWY06_23720 [Pseudomonas sp.]|uniref:hypothetical protein n=1 Tax=Pseudomonas sp. TaxID=306 RepID=UPI00339587D6